MHRLQMLAEEFRLYKIETDDRLFRLEAPQRAADEASVPATASQPAPKKPAAEAATPEKDAV